MVCGFQQKVISSGNSLLLSGNHKFFQGKTKPYRKSGMPEGTQESLKEIG
jgi:hypothetical protein